MYCRNTRTLSKRIKKNVKENTQECYVLTSKLSGSSNPQYSNFTATCFFITNYARKMNNTEYPVGEKRMNSKTKVPYGFPYLNITVLADQQRFT